MVSAYEALFDSLLIDVDAIMLTNVNLRLIPMEREEAAAIDRHCDRSKSESAQDNTNRQCPEALKAGRNGPFYSDSH